MLLSGRGSNYQALHLAQEEGRLGGRILGVISDQPGAPGLARARQNETPAECIDRSLHPARSSFESSLSQAIAYSGAYWIVLAGFMRVLSAEFTSHHAGRIINIHPSLLPRHRGLNTHQRVIEAGDPEHGASVHFVTAELDGGPVISQARLTVTPKDSPEGLAARLLPLEHRLFPATMALLLREQVEARNESIFISGKTLDQPLLLGRDLDDRGHLLVAGHGR